MKILLKRRTTQVIGVKQNGVSVVTCFAKSTAFILTALYTRKQKNELVVIITIIYKCFKLKKRTINQSSILLMHLHIIDNLSAAFLSIDH